MESLPEFPLFRDPVGEGVIVRGEAECAACGKSRGWVYAGRMYGPGDNSRKVCPWCIADGSAAAKFGCSFNNATMYSALPETPQMPTEDRRQVEQRTPGYQTWQDPRWRMCCGRACVYLGQARAEDLAEGGKWASVVPDVKADDGEDRSEDEWRNIFSGVPVGAVGVYVFECGAGCGRLRGYWDCH